MYQSHSPESEKFSLFSLFLNYLIKGETRYKDTVDHVIQETHDLSQGKISYYKIDQDKFQIIVHLKQSDPRYFRDLDPGSLKTEDYEKILELMQQHPVQ